MGGLLAAAGNGGHDGGIDWKPHVQATRRYRISGLVQDALKNCTHDFPSIVCAAFGRVGFL
jgi:hypothetical protein